MKEKMIQYFEGCGFSRAEAEKETAIHIREIQRRELPDRITEEQACNYFMMDLIFEAADFIKNMLVPTENICSKPNSECNTL